MSKNNASKKNSSNNGSKSRNWNKSNNSNNNKSRENNFQDRAEKKEYFKGLRAGERGVGKAAIANCARDGSNSSAWYIPNQQLAKDVATIPFGFPTGTVDAPYQSRDITLANGGGGNVVQQNYAITKSSHVVPSIMVMDIVHTIGEAVTSQSPINLAGAQMYTALQIKSGRTPSYEQADVTLAELAMAEAYAYYVYLMRIYGYMTYYDSYNHYLPYSLITAMGVDFYNIRSHMADFRAGINQIAYRLGSFPVVNKIDYINRRIFMYENVYTDSSSVKPQYYMYNPIGFWRYVEGDGQNVQNHLMYMRLLPDTTEEFGVTGTSVSYQPNSLIDKLLTWEELIDYGNGLIEPLRSSQDILRISADIINTYGAGSMFSISPIAETYSLRPVYNKEVLSQMENAYVYPSLAYVEGTIQEDPSISAGYITMPNFGLIFDYARMSNTDTGYTENPIEQLWRGINASRSSLQGSGDIVLNFHDINEPTPDDILVATRLSNCSVGDMSVSETYGFRSFVPSIMGTELVCGMRIIQAASNNNPGLTIANLANGTIIYRNNNGTSTPKVGWSLYETATNKTPGPLAAQVWSPRDMMYWLHALEAFDWHPFISWVYVDGDVATTASTTISVTDNWGTGDYDNYTMLDPVTLKNITDMAVLGEFSLRG